MVFEQLCAVLGVPDMAQDADFNSAGGRSVNRVRLRQQLIASLAQFECEPLVRQLSDQGVPCAPILDVPQALNHPHTQHRGMIVSLPGYRGLGSPIKLSRTPATYRRPPPKEQ